MNLRELVAIASDKENFTKISDYVDFCVRFLDFAAHGLQAVIVSQNESHYRFYQYKKDGHFNVTRPINSDLMYDAANSHVIRSRFLKTLRQAKDIPAEDDEEPSSHPQFHLHDPAVDRRGLGCAACGQVQQRPKGQRRPLRAADSAAHRGIGRRLSKRRGEHPGGGRTALNCSR